MFNSVQAGKIFRILEKEKPDLVLTHSLKGLGYRIPSVLRKMKIRNIHTVHDMQLIHPSCLLPRRKSFFAAFRILFLGQVEEYKGILDLIDAVKAFEGKIGLEVVGDGKALLKAKNRALGSPQIRFWGRMDHVQLEWDGFSRMI